jgi:SAM-dependent methyltransferase
MTEQSASYIHGTDPAEQERLTRLNRLLNDSSLEAIRPQPGERVIDFGCGLAQFTRALARASGVPALGIERSAGQIAEARRQAEAEGEAGRIELREGDAMNPPLRADEWGSFDLAHARFVLEHVPDPLAVVSAMVRAVKPGGRIVLEDDDHDVFRPWPEPDGLAEIWTAYQDTYRAAGNDPWVGRKLVDLLHRAGARPRRNRWLFFGAASGDPDFVPLVGNLVRILAGARDTILAGSTLDAATFDRALAATRKWGERPDAALWFSRCWAEGVKAA